MSFDVDRVSWAHVALCADLTWAAEPPDEFIIANQRLWAQHCRVQPVLQETTPESQRLQAGQPCDLKDNTRSPHSPNQENGSSSRRTAKDVIPESRLAQYYGNFYYDEHREKCYSNTDEKSYFRSYNGQGRENTDLTECWMLPEVEYWFRKLLDDCSDRSLIPRRRHQYRMLPDDDLCVHVLFNYYTASERCGPSAARGEEAALAARLDSVRGLWTSPARSPPRAPSPPPASRKIRARRRQPRRTTAVAPPPAYCLEVPAQLFCDPTCKIQFDNPRTPQLDSQRAMGRLTATVTAAIRASTSRCPPYRGTNISRYAPTGQRPARCQERRYIWWPRDHPSPRPDRSQNLAKPEPITIQTKKEKSDENDAKEETETEEPIPSSSPQLAEEDDPKVIDEQAPSTSAAAIESGLRQKRLYSTVLSMSAPQISLTPVGCVRLAQKLAPGILKLNPKIVLPSARIRPNVDHKFEELEKEALEQYKASDESIDTKFQELEKQAEEQYSNSNSNTSCSSGNSAEKKPNRSSSPEDSKKQPAKFLKEKPVDSVVIYSQNFPDLNTKHVMNLKNFHGPPRGGKKGKSRSLKSETQRAASDTDYEAKEAVVKSHKGPMRWTLHVAPKKRHLTVCVTDFSSDDETDSIKDAGLRGKTGKMKMSAHGGGDLHPMMRKT